MLFRSHRVAFESLNIVANTLTPAVPAAPAVAAAPAPPPPARADNYGNGSRRRTPPRDARDDITQRKVDKSRRQRAARVGFEDGDSDESPDGEIRGAECFHYKIREAMPPKRFKPNPTDADKYDGTEEPKAWIEDYLQNVILHKGNQIAAMQCFQLYLKDSARAWLRKIGRASWRERVSSCV